MKVTEELKLSNFDFWGGAKERAEMLTTDELNSIEYMIEELFPDGIDATQLNDIFWFDFDWIAQMLDYEDEEDFFNKRNND